MLLRFSVENYKSLRDTADLVLHDGDIKHAEPASAGGVFGGNGAGKSNILSAMAWFSQAVHDSLGWADAHWESGSESSGIPITPFAYSHDDEHVSKFAVDVNAHDGIRYRYETDVADVVLGERLYSYPHGRRRMVFERNRGEITLGRGVRGSRFLKAVNRKDMLLLSIIMRAREHPLTPLAKCLGDWRVIPSGLPRLEDSPLLGIFGKVAAGDATHLATRQSALGLVRLADPTIADVVEVSHVDGMIFPDQQWCVIHQTDQGKRLVLVDHASSGVRTMLAISAALIKALSERQVLLFEDLDRCLHPSVAKAIIAIFRNRQVNPAGSQLIFTANDTDLLHQMTDGGERPAKAWWAEKGADGATTLMSDLSSDSAHRRNTECAKAALVSVAGVASAAGLDTARLAS